MPPKCCQMQHVLRSSLRSRVQASLSPFTDSEAIPVPCPGSQASQESPINIGSSKAKISLESFGFNTLTSQMRKLRPRVGKGLAPSHTGHSNREECGLPPSLVLVALQEIHTARPQSMSAIVMQGLPSQNSEIPSISGVIYYKSVAAASLRSSRIETCFHMASLLLGEPSWWPGAPACLQEWDDHLVYGCTLQVAAGTVLINACYVISLNSHHSKRA